MSQDRRVAPLPKVCRLLRTKTAYGVGEHGAEWKRGESTTAAYWCLATMEAFGADDDYCHPHRCVAGRSCYQPDESDDE
jgi:hypothetical protein